MKVQFLSFVIDLMEAMKLVISFLIGIIIFINILFFCSYNISNVNDLKVRTKNVSRILVISKWRSGSTFFNGLIQELLKDDIFRVHEPLHNFNVEDPYSHRLTMNKNLVKMMNCEFSKVTELIDYYKKKKSRKDILKYMSMIDYSLNKTCTTNSSDINCNISDIFDKICIKKQVMSIKVVRYPLRFITDIFPLIDNLKVFWLVRDPRRSMASRQLYRKSWCKKKCIDEKFLCWRLSDDLVHAKILKKMYPNNFMIVKYEDVVEDSVNQLQAIKQFLNLNNSASYIASLAKPSSSTTEDITKYIDIGTIRNIERLCLSIFKFFDYKIMEFNQLFKFSALN